MVLNQYYKYMNDNISYLLCDNKHRGDELQFVQMELHRSIDSMIDYNDL
jgi:hypothetical protein